jgi:hypothetical protein
MFGQMTYRNEGGGPTLSGVGNLLAADVIVLSRFLAGLFFAGKNDP